MGVFAGNANTVFFNLQSQRSTVAAITYKHE